MNSTDKSQAAATAGAKLDSIILWSKLTAITTLVGASVLVAVCLYGVTEYIRFKTAVISAANELEKARGEFATKFKTAKKP